MKIEFEKVVSNSGSSFAILHKQAGRFRGTYHFHPEIEITAIERGRGIRLIGDDISPYQPGDFVIIGSNLPHRFTSDPDNTADSIARVIQFPANLLCDHLLKTPELALVRGLLADTDRGLSFGPEALRVFKPTIEIIFNSQGIQRLMALFTLLHDMAKYPERVPIASPGYSSKVKFSESSKINTALNHIHEHLSDPISLGEVASLLKVSSATCNRLFRKSLGKSFKDFLIEVRISRACKRLIESDDPITQIASDCGFYNLSNFNKQFKRRKGMTPREYRRQMAPANRIIHHDTTIELPDQASIPVIS